MVWKIFAITKTKNALYNFTQVHTFRWGIFQQDIKVDNSFQI